jgi:serine/threonine protein kinase
MAPEVAMGVNYNKSVDIWAIGIIMHIAITGGKHPFLTDGDTYESFKGKLKNLEIVKPFNALSELAQNLFAKLVALKPHQRYIAHDAL